MRTGLSTFAGQHSTASILLSVLPQEETLYRLADNVVRPSSSMAIPNDTRVRNRLRNVVGLLAIVALIALGVFLARALGPSSAVVEQRAAERAAWEKTQTAEQLARSEAWQEAVRELRRQRGLIALVSLIGNLIVVVTCIRSTLANAREVAARSLRPGAAFLSVLRRGTAALGAACAIMIAVPLGESLMFPGNGMYAGEQMLAALFTMISFLVLWMLSLGLAAIVLWRRSVTYSPGSGRSTL